MAFDLANPTADVEDPFSDLVPDNVSPQIIGGETPAAPAYQTVRGTTTEVPRAITATFEPPDLGPFSDLVDTTSPPPVDNYEQQFGMFSDLVPRETPATDAVMQDLQSRLNPIETDARRSTIPSEPIIPRSGTQFDVEEARQFAEAEPIGPLVKIPKATIRQEESIGIKANKAIYNTAASFVEGLTSPEGLHMVLNPVIAAVGVAKMVPGIIERINAADKTPPFSPERLQIGADVAALLATPAVLHAVTRSGGPKTAAESPEGRAATPAQPVPEAQPEAAQRAGAPTISQPKLPQSQPEVTAAPEESKSGEYSELSKQSKSWVIRNKETGEVIMETTDPKKVQELNTKKYEAVPITDYLYELNQPKSQGEPNATEEISQQSGVQAEPESGTASGQEAETGARDRVQPAAPEPETVVRESLSEVRPADDQLARIQELEVRVQDALATAPTPVVRSLSKLGEEGYDRADLATAAWNAFLDESEKRPMTPDQYEAGLRNMLNRLQPQIQPTAAESAATSQPGGKGGETTTPPAREPTAENNLLGNLGVKREPVPERPLEGIRKAVEDVVAESRKQGIVPPGTAEVQGAIEGTANLVKQIRGVPKFGDFERAINQFGRKLQTTYLDATELQKTIKAAVPDELQRKAVFTYMDAGGDAVKLADWAAQADPKKFPEYKAALNLSPEQTTLADSLTQFFDTKGTEGQAAGVLRNFREDYINRIVDRRKTTKAGGAANVGNVGLAGGRLSKSFKFGKERIFDTAFEAEQKGIRYVTKDPAQLVPIYLTEMNKTIASRELIADLAHGKASDSRALAYPMGASRVVGEGEPQTRLIKPNLKQRVADEITGEDVSSHDYIPAQHPALSKYKWVDTDAQGNPIMVEGQLALHPEIARHVNNIFGTSAIRRWYNSSGTALAALPKGVVRTLDRLNQSAKSYLFSGSGFHHVTMSKKGFDIGAQPIRNFFKTLPQSAALKGDDPRVQFWMEHGSQLAPDNISAGRFMEGFSGKGPERIPLYGRWVKTVSSHLFERFVPAMKMTVNEMYFGKNKKVFAKELAAGDVTEDQLAYLSAKQGNEALSHINYVDIGRNPTLQHIFSMSELAPDFLESRTRFTARAVAGMTGAKQGRLAMRGFVWGMAHTWVAARILNQLIDGDPHYDEPFGLVHNGRIYSLRTVYGDALQLLGGIADLAHGQFSGERLSRFLQSRESPLAKLATMILTGVNYRGEKTSSLEAMREFIGTYVPIWAKAVPGLRELTETTRNNPVSPIEQFMGAWGLHQRRYSPISKTYSLANDWKREAGIPRDTGTYPVSKYQQLRYALEDGDTDKVKVEYQKLLDSGMKPSKVKSGFHESLFTPFAGSQANDRKFSKSLSPEDRAIYEAAVKRRHDVFRLFNQTIGR